MTGALDTARRLQQLISGHMQTQCTYVVAKLGIVDRIPEGGSAHVDELARAVGANADALYRVLRALAGEGLFVEVSPRTFGTTELGELLRGRDGSLRDLALMHGEQIMPLFMHTIETVRTGMPVPVLRDGQTRWEQLAADPEQAEIFNRAMRARAFALIRTACSLDWSDVRSVVDVGGGIGGVLLPLLQQEQHMHGTLFDLAQVEQDAQAAIQEAGLADRCSYVSGDFFEAVPADADVYLLSNVLHDWNDADALRILATCRAAVRARSSLVVLENLIPQNDEPHPAKMLDVLMLVMLGGRERTADEFRMLLEAGGFELVRVTGDAPAALEARPA